MVHAVSVPGGNPGIFWYWNCDPSEAVITRQLTEIRDAGFRSVSLHPMPDSFRKRDFFAGMRIPIWENGISGCFVLPFRNAAVLV